MLALFLDNVGYCFVVPFLPQVFLFDGVAVATAELLFDNSPRSFSMLQS